MSIATEESVDIEIEVVVAPYDDTSDGNEHHTHIINPPNNVHIWAVGMTAKEVVTIARVNGLPVTALCGYQWVPKRNPDKYPACEKCMDEAHNLMRGKGE